MRETMKIYLLIAVCIFAVGHIFYIMDEPQAVEAFQQCQP